MVRTLKIKAFALLSTCIVLSVAPCTSIACSLAEMASHVPDPQLKASDTTPPQKLNSPNFEVTRGLSRSSGCTGVNVVNTCDDIGFIRIHLNQPEDAQTPDGQMGYFLRLVRGQTPDDMRLPQDPVRAFNDSSMTLYWLDGATNNQESIDFTLEILPVDLAGNVGEPTTVRIYDAGSANCQIIPLTSSTLMPVWCVALGLLWLRTRQNNAHRKNQA